MLSSHVRRVRLKVREPSQVARARRTLEDALRQANFDSSLQRLVIVRKLKLASIRSGTAPSIVSSLIKKDVRPLQRLAVPEESSAAADAAAVFFESPVSACVAL